MAHGAENTPLENSFPTPPADSHAPEPAARPVAGQLHWAWIGAGLLLLTGAAVLWWQGQSAVQTAMADENTNNENAAGESGQSKPAADGKPAETPEAAPAGKVEYPRPQRIKLPAGVFDGATGWLNTSGPIELEDLRGKIVLVDFWTYCCINCIHVLPDLKYLEKKYPNELVVIGCHSAKFDNEKESENIRNAILRYEIEHPVINDSEMAVWRRFGVRSWPSLLVIDAEGQACLLASGEGNREYLDELVGKLIAYHRSNNTLDETPVRFDLERNRTEPTPLRFPGKILADEANGRLFISDSNHNRIVISSLDGKLLETVGSGAIGKDDGPYATAKFDHPQGMALVGDILYVADTENHLLRAVDLKRKTVSTLSGTGKQAAFRSRGGELLTTALNSPWDLLVHKGVMYIAMAGPHQIWSHKLGSNEIGVFAGSGREDILDGPHAQSALAQPSGLTTDGKHLFVCDSEGSAIRRIDFDPAGEVTTLAGPSDLQFGRSLFEFGDIDGKGGTARFQHALGAVHLNGKLFIADSYNHKIRVIDIATADVTTWLGTGKPGEKLAAADSQINEPAGLAIAGGSLLIADTNNHRILKVDLKTKAASEFTVAGLTPPEVKTTAVDAGTTEDISRADAQTVKGGKALTIQIQLTMPEGYKLNELAPVKVQVKSAVDQKLFPIDALNTRQKATVADSVATVSVPLAQATGSGTYEISVSYGYCRGGEGGVCKLKSARWSLPLTVAADAKQSAVKLLVE